MNAFNSLLTTNKSISIDPTKPIVLLNFNGNLNNDGTNQSISILYNSTIQYNSVKTAASFNNNNTSSSSSNTNKYISLTTPVISPRFSVCIYFDISANPVNSSFLSMNFTNNNRAFILYNNNNFVFMNSSNNCYFGLNNQLLKITPPSAKIHITIVFNSYNSCTTYYNSTNKNTVSWATLPLPSNDSSFNIFLGLSRQSDFNGGTNFDGNYGLQGNIYKFELYNYILDDSQVLNSYNKREENTI